MRSHGFGHLQSVVLLGKCVCRERGAVTDSFLIHCAYEGTGGYLTCVLEISIIHVAIS